MVSAQLAVIPLALLTLLVLVATSSNLLTLDTFGLGSTTQAASEAGAIVAQQRSDRSILVDTSHVRERTDEFWVMAWSFPLRRIPVFPTSQLKSGETTATDEYGHEQHFTFTHLSDYDETCVYLQAPARPPLQEGQLESQAVLKLQVSKPSKVYLHYWGAGGGGPPRANTGDAFHPGVYQRSYAAGVFNITMPKHGNVRALVFVCPSSFEITAISPVLLPTTLPLQPLQVNSTMYAKGGPPLTGVGDFSSKCLYLQALSEVLFDLVLTSNMQFKTYLSYPCSQQGGAQLGQGWRQVRMKGLSTSTCNSGSTYVMRRGPMYTNGSMISRGVKLSRGAEIGANLVVCPETLLISAEATSGVKIDIVPFSDVRAKETEVYVDRSYVFTTVGDFHPSCYLIRQGNHDKNTPATTIQTRLGTNIETVVYLDFWLKKIMLRGFSYWRDGWAPINTTSGKSAIGDHGGPGLVFARRFPAGAIELHGNDGLDTGCYLVTVCPASTLTTQIEKQLAR